MVNVLMIDDDPKLCKLLEGYLADHKIALKYRNHPHEGKKAIGELRPDLVILDVMMPDQDGFELCKEIRSEGNDIPIIMLTARGETMDRIVGLEIGSDDYLAKPFEPRELAARIHTVVRRSKQPTKGSPPMLKFGDLEINTAERNVFLEGSNLDLTTAEYEFIQLITSQPGKKFTRDEIMNSLSGVDASAFSRSIDIMVSRLRQKLNDTAKAPKYIKTVWGTGYVFVGKSS